MLFFNLVWINPVHWKFISLALNFQNTIAESIGKILEWKCISINNICLFSDINECLDDSTNTCQPHQCQNLDGSYRCSCNPGYQFPDDSEKSCDGNHKEIRNIESFAYKLECRMNEWMFNDTPAQNLHWLLGVRKWYVNERLNKIMHWKFIWLWECRRLLCYVKYVMWILIRFVADEVFQIYCFSFVELCNTIICVVNLRLVIYWDFTYNISHATIIVDNNVLIVCRIEEYFKRMKCLSREPITVWYKYCLTQIVHLCHLDSNNCFCDSD